MSLDNFLSSGLRRNNVSHMDGLLVDAISNRVAAVAQEASISGNHAAIAANVYRTPTELSPSPS
jgi:hypothetical protein